MGCCANKQQSKNVLETNENQFKSKTEDSKAELKQFRINKNPILQRRASQKSPLTNHESFLTRNA
ncbi:unnamed protein product (macronuclear) [Paramecium tetraurelia]|uniref:Uncharacterized protein n=1 Tax=Paramecium tetraurelia TaxID=5888 RepID=A0CTQ6_PARTE|nr:uncharacterized protein GSPATT00010407001 [Paramecium tetraurelia]CAK74173.1 unnamed protein product [Paramecium tetraurelia]|eukprot:XP_001441570.1 hypothetical protein (macronuclear) [Paramecium tetraurelia strain d4-2]